MMKRWIGLLCRMFFVPSYMRRFVKHNLKIWKKPKRKKSNNLIVFEAHTICETLLSFSYFINVLSEKYNAKACSYSNRFSFLNRGLRKVLCSFGSQGHIVTHLKPNQKKIRDDLFYKHWSSIKTHHDLYNLTIDGFWIGVDIYESYLRRFLCPTVDMKDPRLFSLTRESIGLLVFWNEFFKNHIVKGVVVTHDVYVEMNIICKVAYKHSIPVFLPSSRFIVCAKTPYSCHLFFRDFKKMFQKLNPDQKKEGLAWAKSQLDRRLNGEVGVDMAYSKKSAFGDFKNKLRVIKESSKIKILVTTHDFFDNPQAWGQILFPDFYLWLKFLGGLSYETDYEWYIKTHPDATPITLNVINEILTFFQSITLLPSDTSHLQIANEGIDYVLTCHGTVGIEYPLLGVQVINAGYNPHIAYDFNFHPVNRDEYKTLLLSLASRPKKVLNPNEIYECYYMFKNYSIADDLIFDSWRQWMEDRKIKQLCDSDSFDYFLRQVTPEKHQTILNKMTEFVNSGKPFYFMNGSSD